MDWARGYELFCRFGVRLGGVWGEFTPAMLRRAPAARFATAAARPAALPKGAPAAAAKATPKISASSPSTSKPGAKGKKGTKGGRGEVVIAVVEKPRYTIQDVFSAPIKEWQKTATYKDIIRKVSDLVYLDVH